MGQDDLDLFYQMQAEQLANAGQGGAQLTPGLLSNTQNKNQENIQNMLNGAAQNNQALMAANQNLQAQQDALGQASMQQAMAEEQKKQQQRQQLLGLGLTLATGGFGGFGGGAGAGAKAATTSMPILNTTGNFFPMR